MSRFAGVRQRLHVELSDDELNDASFDVTVWAIDHDVVSFTFKRHPDWPGREDNPVGFLMLLGWVAGRRAGEIPMPLKYEEFKGRCVDVWELEEEPVDPTPPAPGAG